VIEAEWPQSHTYPFPLFLDTFHIPKIINYGIKYLYIGGI
jgi:hypothetical protein